MMNIKEEEEEEENEEQDDDGMPPLSQLFLLTPQQMESSCNSKGKPVFVLASRERERCNQYQKRVGAISK